MDWDPNTIKIRTKTVEKTLEPLVKKVTNLVGIREIRRRRKGGPTKKAPKLAKDIEDATTRLVEVGKGIADDFPEIREPMLEAIEDATVAGESMRACSTEFVYDPACPTKRGKMVKASRSLLSSVTRLLCIADMADVHRLLSTLSTVERRLKELEDIRSTDELVQAFQTYDEDLMNLAKLTGIRQADLMDPVYKDEMAASRATLKNFSRMLLSTSKAYITHPNLDSAVLNRKYVVKEVGSAFHTISNVAQAIDTPDRHPYREVGKLAHALDDLMSHFVRVKVADFQEQELDTKLQELVDELVGGSLELAESANTRDETKESIYAQCEQVKDAMHNLCHEFLKAKSDDSEGLIAAKDIMERNVKSLSKHLRRSVVDNVLDCFLETSTPLQLLVEAAQSGNPSKVGKYVRLFNEHAQQLYQACEMACSMSSNPEGIRMVKLASSQAHRLQPEVVNAARTLASYVDSADAQENMQVFREQWLIQVNLLTEAIDDITPIDDFLKTSEKRVEEDSQFCMKALTERGEVDTARVSWEAIEKRVHRVVHLVSTEMEKYEDGDYSRSVHQKLQRLSQKVLPLFLEHITSTDIKHESIDVASLLCEAMKDIRRVVANRKPGEKSEDEDDDRETLLAFRAKEQSKQREMFAYQALKAGGKLQFEVHSEGTGDRKGGGVSSIMVNGVEYCPRKHGHNVVVLDQVGSVVSAKVYDTSSLEEGEALARHLEDIPEDHVALIAVQGSAGDGIGAASDVLKDLGAVGPFHPGQGASWAFAGYKGDHQSKSWVSQMSRPCNKGPAMMADTVNTPAADRGQIKVELEAEGCEDDPYRRMSSIRVNDVERSTMGRGMNVVVLDSAGSYLASKNFDTADPYHAQSEGRRMARFLDELPDETIVCIASLESVGEGMEEARQALFRLARDDPINPGPNGSFCFLGYTGPGSVGWLMQGSCERGGGPTYIEQFLTTHGKLMVPESRERSYSERSFSDKSYSESLPKGYRDRILSDDESQMTLSLRSARSLMRALPDEEKTRIKQIAESLHVEKSRLITEVNKWDDQGNELIVLAKKMCTIMMDMSDFTKGKGPIKTTADVVKAAEKIAKYGSQMNKLASEIAEMCAHSSIRTDLLDCLQRVGLYSHQLTITGRRRADVQVISGEVIVIGAEKATSLIEASKNLMNAVIQTVKASYTACTRHKQTNVVVSWRMRAPDKKPLFSLDV